MPVFKIVTLGCKVNQYESACLEESLLKDGWLRAKKGQFADLVIINTCIVTQKAAHQSRQEIRRAMRENSGAILVATGCYAQVYPEELLKIDGLNIIVGNRGKEQIPSLIKGVSPSDKLLHIQEFSKKEPFSCMSTGPFFERSRAFLKIQDGCESFCSYCIVPYARGPYRSMSIKDVLVSIEQIIDKGYKEVVLTGIHLGKYGIDQGTSLEPLLKEIGRQKYPIRIRLSSIEPNEISKELLEIILKEDWICKHLHIPLQSGDNGILKRMNRRYKREDFYRLVTDIHDQAPLCAIGTDIMVGFPGETRSAYQNTFSIIKDLPVSYLHIFPYADRPKTAAFHFREKIPPQIIKERARNMRELGGKKKKEFLNRCIGQIFHTIVESQDKDGLFKGVTENYINVIFPYREEKHWKPVRVRIEKTRKDIALGKLA